MRSREQSCVFAGQTRRTKILLRIPRRVWTSARRTIGYIMNKRTFLRILAAVFVCPVCPGQPKDSSEKIAPPVGLENRLKRFFAEMRGEAAALAKQTNEPIAPEIQDFLEAGEKGDWKTVAANYWDSTVVGQTVRECYGAYDQFVQG